MYYFNPVNQNELKTEMASHVPETNDLGYGQILGVFWRRRSWFLITFLVIFFLGAWQSVQKKAIYESYMKILVEPNYQVNPDRGEFSDLTENSVEVDYSTQLNLMRSSELLQQAVDRLRANYPEINIGMLRDNLRLERVNERDVETKLFQANYVDDDPLKTQAVLSAILGVYQEYNLEQQNQRLTEGLSFTQQQIAIARANLAEMEASMRDFRTEHDLVSPETKAQALATRLDGVEQEREQLSSSYQGTLARYNSLKAQLGRSSLEAMNAARLSESVLYQNLFQQLQENELALIEARTRFTDASPTVQALLQERQELSELLRQEKVNLLASPGEDFGSNNPGAEQLSSTELELVGELLETETELANLAGQEQSLVGAERQLRANLNQFPALLTQYESLQQEIEVKRATLQQLLEAQQELGIEINRGGFNWQLVEPPLAGRQIAPNRKQDLLLAGVVAVFLGGVVAFAQEALDSAIHSSDQLQERTSFPLLGVVPRWKSLHKQHFLSNLPLYTGATRTTPSLTIFQWRPFRESLDLIYKNIQLLNRQSPPKSIAVTSAVIGEGKSTTAIGLALSASRLHQRVLVIDGNLRQPFIHEMLEVSNQEGLTDFLMGKFDSPPLQTFTGLDSQIEILTAGTPIDDPVKLLSSQGMEALLKSCEQIYDLVLIDTPAVLGVADTMHVASCTQAVILVGGLAQINQAELQSATSLLGRLNLIGIIANGTKDTSLGGRSAPALATSELSESGSYPKSGNNCNNSVSL